MTRIHEIVCSVEQFQVLKRNENRYAYVVNQHIRIRETSSDLSTHPSGAVRYVACIELLSEASDTWGRAEPEAIDVISDLFVPTLSEGRR